jgi:hypothetical protein
VRLVTRRGYAPPPVALRYQVAGHQGIQIYPDEVVAQGPPWNTTLCVRGTDHLDTEDGRVYENRYVIWGRIAWGRLREYEVYEDTQAAKSLDEYLARRTAGPA